MMTMEAVNILLGEKPDWDAAKKTLNDSQFMEKLKKVRRIILMCLLLFLFQCLVCISVNKDPFIFFSFCILAVKLSD